MEYFRSSTRGSKSLKPFNVKGRVFSGDGKGARFIKLPWVREQIIEKLGFIPYPGTLNIKISEDIGELKESLKRTKEIEISPAKGFCRGRCFKACFMDNIKCAIIIPEVENYPEDVIEVIASINLREKFQLKDGDMTEVKILS